MTGDGFTKLFSSILTSSIWSEDDKTRILWITILACTDKDGFCQAAVPGLAAMARLTVQDTVTALARLEGPDPYSRTQDYEGRRIEKADGGWIVLNHGKYRDRERVERRREYQAEHIRNKRRKAAESELTDVNRCQQDVNKMSTGVDCSVSVSVSASESVSGEGGAGEGAVPPAPPAPPAFAEYGELQKVRLTADEHSKLTHTHGAAKLAQGIDILDAYIASSGKRYKSHYAVLKPSGWVWERVAGQGQPPAHQNALRGGFQRVQEAPAEPNRRTPEEWDRIIAADEARKKGVKA